MVINPRWSFLPKRPDDLAQEDPSAEFFTPNHVETLIRESVQNSLDAAADEQKPVVERFGFVTTDRREPRSRQFFNEFEKSLQDPANKEFSDVFDQPSFKTLVVEDFNTVGLTGDPSRHEVPPDTDRTQRFFYFWRSRGRGKKDTGRRGRWGIGKKVFGLSSQLSTFYGLTIRDDSKPYLMGFAELKVHRAGEAERVPTGYFGIDGQIVDSTLPVQDLDLCKQFCASFGVTRRDEPGFSVVIPYVQPSIDHVSVRQTALKQYFLPLLKGELVVKIESPGAPSEMLDGAAVRKWAVMQTDDPVFRLQVELAIDHVDGALETIEVQGPIHDKMADWSFESCPSEIQRALKRAWEEKGRVRVRIEVDVKRKGEVPHKDALEVLMARLAEGPDRPAAFVREGILVTKAAQGNIQGAAALVIVDRGDLGTFLGDAENVAHTSWDSKGLGSRYRYENSFGLLGFVQRSPVTLWRFLEGRIVASADISLADVFGLTLPASGEDPPPTRGHPPGPGTGGPVVPVGGRPRRYHVVSLDSGIRLASPTDFDQRKIGTEITLRLGYAVRQGNGVGKWKSYDFEVDKKPITTKGSNLEILYKGKNQIKLKILGAPYTFDITGFDTNRDLDYEVR